MRVTRIRLLHLRNSNLGTCKRWVSSPLGSRRKHRFPVKEKVITQTPVRGKLKYTSSSTTEQRLAPFQPCATTDSLLRLTADTQAGKAGVQAWIFADTQQYFLLSGKVLPALHCYILPFPPCTYFSCDINGRGIPLEGKGSTGEPFPGQLPDDIYQTQDLAEVVIFLFLHRSLNKYSYLVPCRVTRWWIFLCVPQECECYTYLLLHH